MKVITYYFFPFLVSIFNFFFPFNTKVVTYNFFLFIVIIFNFIFLFIIKAGTYNFFLFLNLISNFVFLLLSSRLSHTTFFLSYPYFYFHTSFYQGSHLILLYVLLKCYMCDRLTFVSLVT